MALLEELKKRHGDSSDLVTDWHCHLLPDIDDGPKDLNASLELIGQLQADGVKRVIVTPHRLHPHFPDINHDLVLDRFALLQEAIRQQQLDFKINLGGEVRIDERLFEDQSLTLKLCIGERKKFLLLELPTEIEIDPSDLIVTLKQQGIKVIVAHVERYNWLFTNRGQPKWQSWLQAGAWLQINTSSVLTPEYSDRMSLLLQYASWVMMASDAHGGLRIPRWEEAASAMKSQWGEAITYEVMMGNPNLIYSQAFG